MAVYAIGDLQGCYDPFCRLLDKLAFDPAKDRLWLAGDLVNRGPKSLKTLRLVRSLDHAVTVVLGNHDLHLLALDNDIGVSDNRFDSMWKILAADDGDELLDWLRHRPLAHYDQQLDTLMVHAGLPPSWSAGKALKRAAEVEEALRADDYPKFLKKMYGNTPARWSGKLTGNKRLRFIVNALTRLRMIDADGNLDFDHKGPPASARRGLIPWFDAPSPAWAGTRIVFGHWSALGLRIERQLVSLDSGCVWGRQLSAVRLDGEPDLYQVECGQEPA